MANNLKTICWSMIAGTAMFTFGGITAINNPKIFDRLKISMPSEVQSGANFSTLYDSYERPKQEKVRTEQPISAWLSQDGANTFCVAVYDQGQGPATEMIQDTNHADYVEGNPAGRYVTRTQMTKEAKR